MNLLVAFAALGLARGLAPALTHPHTTRPVRMSVSTSDREFDPFNPFATMTSVAVLEPPVETKVQRATPGDGASPVPWASEDDMSLANIDELMSLAAETMREETDVARPHELGFDG